MKTRKAGRPRKVNRQLPPRVYEHHGSYWYHPSNGPRRRLGRIGVCELAELAPLCAVIDKVRVERAPIRHRLPMRDRLMKHIKRDGGCWQWTGSKNNAGYGQVHIGGKTFLAHRLSYESFVGLVPEGLQLDHLCRDRSCINPAHLDPVTASVNTKRGYDARQLSPVGSHGYSPFVGASGIT